MDRSHAPSSMILAYQATLGKIDSDTPLVLPYALSLKSALCYPAPNICVPIGLNNHMGQVVQRLFGKSEPEEVAVHH